MLVVVSRLPAVLERRGGFTETRLVLPEEQQNRTWLDILSGKHVEPKDAVDPSTLPLPWAVLYSATPPATV
jgi:hypothetical protein